MVSAAPQPRFGRLLQLSQPGAGAAQAAPPTTVTPSPEASSPVPDSIPTRRDSLRSRDRESGR